MADDEIPQRLIALQQQADAAQAAVRAASRNAVDQEELDRLRTVEREAVLDLVRARTGTPWESWSGQQQLHAAARPRPDAQ